MRHFANEEIWHPKGPFAGRRYSESRQPFSRLFFDLVERPWKMINALGCVQSGKTLLVWVIPILYHLFEVGEDVIAGVPTMNTVRDKWREDLLPVIAHSRYRDLLPVRGGGARGGTNFTAIQFRHGPTLRFMSFGGDDKTRASYPARVVAITEADGGDEIATASHETDKISQIHARTNSFGRRARIYQECTVTHKKGRIWSDYALGTASRIVRPCPHCGDWVSPEREQLTGWVDAESIEEAREKSTWRCPSCGNPWTDDQRRAANASATIVHRGQEITPAGEIVGVAAETDTLGFRWSAIDNHFLDAGDIGADEWKRARQSDLQAGERYMLQFMYATPIEIDIVDSAELSITAIAQRQRPEGRGVVPPDFRVVTVGADISKYRIYWIALAWSADARCHVLDYDQIEVPSREVGFEKAVLIALSELRDICETGWKSDEGRKRPNLVWIDSGWQGEEKEKPVYAFVASCRGDIYQACKGYGAGQERKFYSRPKATGSSVVSIGEGYHFARLPKHKIKLVEIDANQWKSFFHARLTTPVFDPKANGPVYRPGTLTLFKESSREHLTLASHFVAEKKVEEFKRGRLVTKWVREAKANHWFDGAYLACAAGHKAGVRLIPIAAKPKLGQRIIRGRSAKMPPGGW